MRAIPVAVIGMSCRLPGGIHSPEQLWEALLRGDDFVSEIPADRWDAEEYYDPEPGVPGRSVSKWGAFLDDVAAFDFTFFGISEREATAVDPQHRLLLETAWEAVEHAGLDPAVLAGSRTGVFMGLTHNDYAHLAADTSTLESPYGFTGTSFSLASGRIAYALGCNGPAITVDTACSSSLSAIHMACRSLRDGESELALAGGVSVLLEPRKAAGGSAAGMLSPTGRCHAFDVAADGFVSAEGSAVLLLKPFDAAVADGDRILGVIRGTATNQDGRTVNISTPSATAQASVYREALAAAGVTAASVGLVEAHGTGTPVGDPLEFASVAEVYGTEGPCALGSVKTNFGHAQAAAAALGVMKAVLSVRHGIVPKNLHFNHLPDDLASVDTNVFVPQVNSPWPANGGHLRRAAVSAYGLSGTNAHAIIEQAPEAPATLDSTEVGGTKGPQLFPLSSTSAEQLRRTAGRLADWLTAGENTPDRRGVDISDLAYTLARRRGHRSVRTSVIAASHEELIESLRTVADGDHPYPATVGNGDRGPVWVFSGQGSQWAGMGAGLLATEQVFAETVAELEPLILRESGFSVTDAMSAPQVVMGVDRVQPTVFAVQVALAATMNSYGVTPSAVIGHSMGEVAAAVVAGALTAEDGVKVICRRSALMARLSGAGAMASIELPAAQVLSELGARRVTDVSLAVVASPQSTVIGGASQTVRDLVEAWEQRGVMAREIAVDVASHSPQVDPILDELADALADLQPRAPEVAYYSATLYDPREPAEFDAYYWVDNLRHAVRFAAAVQAAVEDGHRVFAELSPHPLLTHAVDQTARSLDVVAATLAGLRRDQEMPHGLRGYVADVHSAGAAVDFSAMFPDGRLVDAPLPSWTHSSLLLSRDGGARDGATVTVHPLLGSHVVLPEEPELHWWQGEVGTAAHPWLDDHRVHDVAVLPAAAYCEMALGAARAVFGDTAEVRDVSFEQALLLDETTPISASASEISSGSVDFVIETHHGGERTARAAARLADGDDGADVPRYDIAALIEAHPHQIDGADLRTAFAAVGIGHGAAFSGLGTAHVRQDASQTTILAAVSLPGPLRSQQGGYSVHPALLDACFQSVLAHPDVQSAVGGGMLLPLSARRLRVYGSTRGTRYCYARVTMAGADGVEADLQVLDDHGAVVLSVTGLRLGAGTSESTQAQRLLNERLLAVEWRLREIPELDTVDAGTFLLINTDDDDDVLTADVGDFLKSAEAQCTTVMWPQRGDHEILAGRLASQVADQALTSVVVLMASTEDAVDEHTGARAGDCVRHLVRIIQQLAHAPGEPPRLYVVTRSAKSVVDGDIPNLQHAGVGGLTRAIGMENPRMVATQIDVDSATSGEQLARQLLSGAPEDETAWRDGQWYTARLCPAPLRADERHTATVDVENGGMRLSVRNPGDLESLDLVAAERPQAGPGQIEVAVGASSINFADVLVAFGRCPSYDGRLPALGSEFGGVVTAVGPGVTAHKVGDRVGGVSANGCWSNFVICEASLATTLPAGLAEYEAAAVGLAYATAWLGLHELARICSTDKVLIHSATGGLGQAAIAVARRAGAQIFATAGSEDRRELLHEWGIEHVYDSRSADFAEAIRRDTDGYGVDVVLNSVTGASQRAGLELLAFGGRFVEVGKRDIYANTRVGLFPFRRNISFHAVDLALMTVTHPDKVRELLQTVYRLTADGSLPLPQITRHPLGEAATAIRKISSAQHTGKLVLDIPQSGYSRVALAPEQFPVFRNDGAYIVTGGLGGLGLFLAEKLAEGGCGRIVLTSRSAPTTEVRERIELIRASGADIVVECGDIAAAGTAERLVAAATASGLAVRGVLHAAAVVEDAVLENITDGLIERDWAPKVHGAWHLHQATAHQPLDWFCSFSSAAALVGSPGQGAYAAANSWLDAFMNWRRAQGLPANSIAWGAWGEIGRGTVMAEGHSAILPDEGANAFESILRYDRAYTGYAAILGTAWLTAFAQRSPFAEEFKSAGESREEGRRLRAELAALPREEWPSLLRRLLSEQVGVILRRSVDPDRPLSEYGLDSLGNLELRTRIESETGIRITSMSVSTVRGLAEVLYDSLAGDEAVASST